MKRRIEAESAAHRMTAWPEAWERSSDGIGIGQRDMGTKKEDSRELSKGVGKEEDCRCMVDRMHGVETAIRRSYV